MALLERNKEANGDSKESGHSFSFNLVLGIMYNTLASCCFTVMNAANKYAYNHSNITPWEVMYWRSLIMVLLNIGTAKACGVSVFSVPKHLAVTLLHRVVGGAFCIVFVVLQFRVLSFSKATVIFFTYPFYAALCAFLLLGERLTKYDILGCICSFSGLLIIILNPYSTKKVNDTEVEPWYGPAVPLVGAMMGAYSDVMIRKLGTGVHFSLTPLYLGLGCVVLSPMLYILAIMMGHPLTQYNLPCVIALVINGIAGFMGQLFLTKALQAEKAGRIAAVAYLQVVNACLVDAFFFGIPFHLYDVLGVFFIVFSNVCVFILKGFSLIS